MAAGGAAAVVGRRAGCFTCGGDHLARDCPRQVGDGRDRKDSLGIGWAQALALFAEVQASRTVPKRSFTAAISACARCGRWEKAFEVLSHMQEARLKPDLAAVASAISACKLESQWEHAMSMLVSMRTAGREPDVACYGAVMAACGTANQWQRSFDLLSLARSARLEPEASQVVGTAIWTCARSYNQWHNALHVLGLARQAQVALDADCLNGGVVAYCTGRKWDDALALLAQMRSESMVPSTDAYEELILACARGRRWAQSLALFEAMQSAGVELHNHTFTLLMRAFNKTEQWQRSLVLYEQLSTKRLEPDALSCSLCISAAGKGRQWKMSLEFLMKQQQITQGATRNTTHRSYTAAVTACAHVARWEHALYCLEDLHRKGHEPTVVALTSAIDACGNGHRWDMSLAVLDRIREHFATTGAPPHHVSFSSVISSCCEVPSNPSGNQWTIAIQVLELIRENSLRPSYSDLHGVILSCQKSYQWAASLKLLDKDGFRQLCVGSECRFLPVVIGACQQAGHSVLATEALEDLRDVLAESMAAGPLQTGRAYNDKYDLTAADLPTYGETVYAFSRLRICDMGNSSLARSFRRCVQGIVSRKFLQMVQGSGTLGQKACQVDDDVLRSINDLGFAVSRHLFDFLGMRGVSVHQTRQKAAILRRHYAWMIESMSPIHDGRNIATWVSYDIASSCRRWMVRCPGKMQRSRRVEEYSTFPPIVLAMDNGPRRAWHCERIAMLDITTRILARCQRARAVHEAQAEKAALDLQEVVAREDYERAGAIYERMQTFEKVIGEDPACCPPGARGKVWMHVSQTPCLSCIGAICQFKGAFPGICLSVDFYEWHEMRRQTTIDAYQTAVQVSKNTDNGEPPALPLRDSVRSHYEIALGKLTPGFGFYGRV